MFDIIFVVEDACCSEVRHDVFFASYGNAKEFFNALQKCNDVMTAKIVASSTGEIIDCFRKNIF